MVQYQKVDRASLRTPAESWGKTIEASFGHRLPDAVEFSSRIRFTEQTVVGQRDRLRNPEGSVRLAHPYFGLSASYQPTEVRDSQSLTRRQQTLMLTANAQKPGLPSLSGSWVRSHLDAGAQTQAAATVSRTLSATYSVPHLAFRAGYGDRASDAPSTVVARSTDHHLTLGSSGQFQVGRAPVSLLYDFTRSRSDAPSRPSSGARAHTAVFSTGLELSPRTSTSMNYSFRRTETQGPFRSSTQDHDGALSLSFRPTVASQMTAAGGVRSARFSGRSESEGFVSTSASISAQARPGWRLAASAGRSYNWLPGQHARAADEIQTNTSMRLARGLEAHANLAVSAGRRVAAASDTGGSGHQVGLQTGFGVTANPLRRISLDASAYRSQTGRSLSQSMSTTTSYSAGLRLSLYSGLQLNGGWTSSQSGTSRGSTLRSGGQWTISSRLQASGTYGRALTRQTGPVPATQRPVENRSAMLAVGLGRNFSGSLRYSESNWGQPSQIRQVNVDVVRSFRR